MIRRLPKPNAALCIGVEGETGDRKGLTLSNSSPVLLGRVLINREARPTRFDVRLSPSSGAIADTTGGPRSATTGHNRAGSFDHLVGAGEKSRRNFDPERDCGGQVENEIELGRLLDWQIAWLHASQNLINILGGAPEQIYGTWPIGHKTSRCEKVANAVNGWQPCAQRQSVDAGVVRVYQGIGADIKCCF